MDRCAVLICAIKLFMMAETSLEATTITSNRSSPQDVLYEEIPSVHDGHYFESNDSSIDLPDENTHEENHFVDKQARNKSEETQNDEPVDADIDTFDLDDTESTTTQTDEEAYKDDDEDLFGFENGESTDNPETTDDALNGSMNETADDIFNIVSNETDDGYFDSLNNETTDDGINIETDNSNSETAEDIFGKPDVIASKYGIADDTFKDVSNKSVEDIFHSPTNGSSRPANSNFSDILEGWIAEQTTKATLVAGNPLFISQALDGNGEVCISLNISVQPSLNGTPIVLLRDYASEKSFSENNGSITLYTIDKDGNNNVTLEFVVSCDENSCSLNLTSVDILNTNRHEGVKAVNQDNKLWHANLSTTFEDFKGKTLNMTNGVALQISYISFFVSKQCVTLKSSGDFISLYYAEILYGLGIVVIAVCVSLLVFWKIQRKKKTSFDTI